MVSNNWFNNSDDYYTVECKRLDGSNDLNKKYVIEGVCRFAIDPPNYPSHNKKNIMLGFIVKRINESILLSKINRIHNAKLSSRKIGEISYVDLGTDYKICESAYIDGLQISHIFYDITFLFNILSVINNSNNSTHIYKAPFLYIINIL